MTNIIKTFDIEVWYRFVTYGEVEKDFEIQTIEAATVEKSVYEASKLYKSLAKIPFAYRVGDLSFKPSQLPA